jgi:predicted AlkP superfamily pyrophosphatase or phosphodiesterase
VVLRRAGAGALLVFLACLTVGLAQSRPPKLLVVLVVDQMRADYIEQFGHHWTKGLRRLLDNGATFPLAAYPYRSTVTCAGHATIATGSFPSGHGMIQNSWWERASGSRVTCTTDVRTTPIAYGGVARERHSPASLRLPTLADTLRLQSTNRPRIVSLSVKPRSAITMAGQAADAVVWFDEAGVWATSSAYTDRAVPEVLRYIEAHPVESQVGGVWTRLLPEGDYRYSDSRNTERPSNGWDNTFPHPLGGDGAGTTHQGDHADTSPYTAWRDSPFSDAYVADMAMTLVDDYDMGQRDHTDYLAIGFSSLDLVGHRFGPRSHEVQDVLARLDVTIGRLLEQLDAQVGPDDYVVALSADHGVSPIPEEAAGLGLDAGRIPAQEIVRQAETLLAELLGPGPHIDALQSGDVYFSPGVFDQLSARPANLDSMIAFFADAPGIGRVLTATELANRGHDHDRLAHAASLSFFAERSGDLILIRRPFWLSSALAADHGTPHDYDTRVPVVLYGPGIAPGRYLERISPADIAPTLAFLSGITLAHPDGRVLVEALAQ